ncbi:MAG: thermonuclease family protein [Spirochaetia bacterium]|nr:thermonuclease family protein [Spirochaetia bacterium]
MKSSFYVKTIFITAAVLVALYLGGLYLKHYNEEQRFRTFTGVVEQVFDGDTVKTGGGRVVRLLGIDTPETNHPDQPVQRMGAEAKKYLKERIEGRTCLFEYDLKNEKDVYGRTLCTIYLDGDNINAELVKQGLAYVYVREHNSRTKDYAVLENIAKKFRRGVWQYGAAGQVKQ